MTRKSILIALTALFTAVSCNLIEDTSGFTNSESFYNNVQECKAALNSCYIPLYKLYNGTMMIVAEGQTDLAYSRSATQDSDLDISPAKPRFGADVWKHAYRGVRYCNGALAGIEASPLNDLDKTPLLAEGKIMRAFYYNLLCSFFGDVPYYTDDVSNQETLEKVTHLPRMSAAETRRKLIDELCEILPYIPQVRSCEITDNRAGAAMGWMLVAKMAAWLEDWDKVLEATNILEVIYGNLDQYPLSDLPFSKKNTPESIFEIQHSFTPGGLTVTGSLACMCMPYPKGSGSIYDGVDMPELGAEARSYAPMQANGYLVGTLFAKDRGDLRRDMCIVTEYNGEIFDYMKNTSTSAFFGPKFWCYNLQSNYDYNNYKVFRYADALLLKAEAYCNKEENVDLALKYLNMTRRRAGLPDFTRRTWTSIKQEIWAERGRELFGEFNRKFDLVRWGVWYERTLEYTRKSKVRENILPCMEYYPIPDVQVSYSGGALDNKAYYNVK